MTDLGAEFIVYLGTNYKRIVVVYFIYKINYNYCFVPAVWGRYLYNGEIEFHDRLDNLAYHDDVRRLSRCDRDCGVSLIVKV